MRIEPRVRPRAVPCRAETERCGKGDDLIESEPDMTTTLPAGTRLGSYELVALVGAGGMGHEIGRAHV